MTAVTSVLCLAQSAPAATSFGLNHGQIAVMVIGVYLALLIALGFVSNHFLRGTANDYFLASRGIGSLLLLLTLFGTTMTAFALVGSTGEAYAGGIAVYGLMVSWSGLIHSACFFLIGIKLWSFGKRYGYVTQIQFFRDRFESDKLGLLLFPILVGLVIPYLLVGIIGGGKSIEVITRGAFPERFAATAGGIPFELGAAVVCLVVLCYVFFGGVRGTTWANAFQTLVFVVLGIVTFFVISDKLGGVENATRMVAEYNPAFLKVGATAEDHANYEEKLALFEAGQSPIRPREPERIPPAIFLTYMFIPLSVATFPHIFQHWLTARSARSFRLPVTVHPLLMLMVWLPCVLIGVWATSAVVNGQAVLPQRDLNPNAILGLMVTKLSNPLVGGLLTAGVLAAIMSSLDSQFFCIGSIFTNDIAGHYIGHDRLSDRTKVILARVFIVVVVVVSYLLSVRYRETRSVFALGVWCFTGFAALAPLIFAALYWRRTTRAGAIACVLTAAVAWAVMFVKSGQGGDDKYAPFGVMPVAINVLASTAALVIVSLCTRPPSSATIDKFFRRIDRAG